MEPGCHILNFKFTVIKPFSKRISLYSKFIIFYILFFFQFHIPNIELKKIFLLVNPLIWLMSLRFHLKSLFVIFVKPNSFFLSFFFYYVANVFNSSLFFVQPLLKFPFSLLFNNFILSYSTG